MKKYPKPNRYIFVCHGKDCLKRGAKELQRGLEHELKVKYGKGIIRVIKTKCMDYCKEAPLIIVDNVRYARVGLKDLEELINKNFS